VLKELTSPPQPQLLLAHLPNPQKAKATCVLLFHQSINPFLVIVAALVQTVPPTIPVTKLFPDGHYPVGEIQE